MLELNNDGDDDDDDFAVDVVDDDLVDDDFKSAAWVFEVVDVEVLEDVEEAVVNLVAVEVLLDFTEVVVLDDVAFVVEELLLDEVELEEEPLLSPPESQLDKSDVLLNASATVPAEFGLPLVTLNLVVNAWLEVTA